MHAAAILALMLSFIPPGRSLYSRTVVDADAPRACDQLNHLLCAKPRVDPHWGGAFTRPETRSEGLVRYWLIAQTIEQVAKSNTWNPHPDCKPMSIMRWSRPPSRACAQLYRQRPWGGTENRLARYMVTIAYHESGLRRDIQTGRGPASKGDCKWRTDKKTGTRTRIAGSCKSTCIGQIMKTRARWLSPRGYKHNSLAGLDKVSLVRCLETMADVLGRARLSCVSRYASTAATGATCILGTYGGVRFPATDSRIASRARTFGRTASPGALAAAIRAELGLSLPVVPESLQSGLQPQAFLGAR